jgi:hypothetical protein
MSGTYDISQKCRGSDSVPTRQCPYCGKLVPDYQTECPHCHERIPEIRTAAPPRSNLGRGKIRQGLLYMLLAAIIHYFAGGYSAMELPFPIQRVVTVYLIPLLFLGGLGMSLHGFYLHHKARV